MTELLLFLTALAGMIAAFKTHYTKKTVDEVHLLVNDRLDKTVEYVGQLVEALRAAGVEVPDPTERGIR